MLVMCLLVFGVGSSLDIRDHCTNHKEGKNHNISRVLLALCLVHCLGLQKPGVEMC